MGISRCGLAGIVLVASIAYRSASAAPIVMPAGSTVWTKFESSVAPLADGNDAAGSNLPGQAPPNGIPLTTITNSNPGYATGYAEIMPNTVRTFLQGNYTSFMHASFQDTYTVGGTATGTFDIPVSLRVTGTMRSQPHGSFGHILYVATVQAEIGTFNADPNFLEPQRVTPFDAAAFAQMQIIGPDARPNPYEFPVDITATYTVQDVSVGDTFALGYGVNSAFAKAEIDLLNGGSISFSMPEGVSLTSTLAQALPAPGSIRIVGNDGVNDGITDVNIPAGNVSGTLEITDNPLVEAINIAAGAVGGDLTITDNDAATVINIAADAVGGNLTLTGNDAAGVLDLGSLGSVAGNLDITDNDAATVINVAADAVGGNLTLTSNDAAGVLDLGSLGPVSGDLTVTDNGDAAVNLAANATVSGDLTLETTSAGTLDLGDVAVGGNSDVTADGYTTVEGNTAAGQTALTMINSEATMELVLPAGAFPAGAPVPFSVEHLPSGAVETVDGNTVTHLESYRFTFDVPTLNQQAELNFEIDLAAMDDTARQSLLDLLDADALLTLAVRGDEPDALLRLFDVCGPGTNPILDECVRVLWFDENGVLLDSLAGVDPSLIRFEGLVGHFSTYSVVAVTAVPEPASLLLLALAALTQLRRRN